MTSPRRGSHRRRPILVSVSALVIATGLIVVAALGGFAAAPEDPPPVVKAGEEIDQDLFRTTVVDAAVRTVSPKPDSGTYDSGEVLDLTLKVFNNATTSVPVNYLDRSLLRIAASAGPPLVEPSPAGTPAPAGDGPAWRHDAFIPDDEVVSRLLPPRLTSTVVLRFPVRDGLTAPERITIDFGKYELHEDWFTGRTRPELIVDDDGREVVEARVALPVKRGAA